MKKLQHGFVLVLLAAVVGALPAQQLVVLSQDVKLTTVAAAVPGTPLSSVTVTGLQAGEKLLGIDYRPVNGALYGLGSSSRLYTIDLGTGVATAVGPQFTTLLSGNRFGFDFNPTVDRIRITSDTGQNLRAHPVTGLIVFTDATLVYNAADVNAGDIPGVTGSAYTNSVAGATSTTLYNIDVENDRLVTQTPPNAGVLNTVGQLGASTVAQVGFDIDPNGNVGYASLTSPGTIVVQSNLFNISLTTGAASFIGSIGVFGKVDGLAVVPVGGTSLTGSPAPGCQGELVLGVTQTATPGADAFGVLVANAPASATGIIALSDAVLADPFTEGGVTIFIDLGSVFFDWFVVTTNPWGTVTTALEIPADPSLIGVTRHFQAAFGDLCAPGNVVVSPALSVTVMP